MGLGESLVSNAPGRALSASVAGRERGSRSPGLRLELDVYRSVSWELGVLFRGRGGEGEGGEGEGAQVSPCLALKALCRAKQGLPPPPLPPKPP